MLHYTIYFEKIGLTYYITRGLLNRDDITKFARYFVNNRVPKLHGIIEITSVYPLLNRYIGYYYKDIVYYGFDNSHSLNTLNNETHTAIAAAFYIIASSLFNLYWYGCVGLDFDLNQVFENISYVRLKLHYHDV